MMCGRHEEFWYICPRRHLPAEARLAHRSVTHKPTQAPDRPAIILLPRTRRELLSPDVVAFDLDETIYPRASGIMQEIGRRITLYIEQYLNVTAQAALAMRKEYVVRHGTTLRGLQLHHQVDADHYMEFVHDVPIEEMIGYDRRLDEALTRIDAQKVIFTNASREHAERVLRARHVRHHFARLIDVRDMDWRSKPDLSAYHLLLTEMGVPAERCMLVEDVLRNLRPAFQLGMSTVLVDGDDPEGIADFVIAETWQIGDVYDALRRQPPPRLLTAPLPSSQ